MDLAVSAPVYDAATVTKLFGERYDSGMLAIFGQPPSPLPRFATFFDFGRHILWQRDRLTNWPLFSQQSWYNTERFASSLDWAGYRQVGLQPIPGSAPKGFGEQCDMLAEEEEAPTARVLVAALATHYLATAQRLLPDVFVRCSDKTTRGSQVLVGFPAEGICLLDEATVIHRLSPELVPCRKVRPSS